MKQSHTRRAFFGRVATGAAKWSPLLGAFGFRLHLYAKPAAVGWSGWVTLCGRLVGFVRLGGEFVPFLK